MPRKWHMAVIQFLWQQECAIKSIIREKKKMVTKVKSMVYVFYLYMKTLLLLFSVLIVLMIIFNMKVFLKTHVHSFNIIRCHCT